MKDRALSFGLIKDKTNYLYALFSTVMSRAAVYHMLEQPVNLK